MMNDRTEKPQVDSEAMLEDLFQSARPGAMDSLPDATSADDAFLARMMENAFDAQDEIFGFSSDVVSRRVPPRKSLFAVFLEAIGGWPSMSGMAVATLAGLWIGTVQPAALTNLSPLAQADSDSIALAEAFGFVSGFDSLQEEG